MVSTPAQRREQQEVRERTSDRVSDARGAGGGDTGVRFSPVSIPNPTHTPTPLSVPNPPNTDRHTGGTGGGPGTSGYYGNYNNWVFEYYRWQNFLWEMSMRYRLSDWDALGRYARQEPLLTNHLVESALRDSLGYSRALLVQALDLKDMVTRLDQDPSLRGPIQERVKAIRQIIKEIQKDRALEYLDLRKTRDAQSPQDKDLKALAERLYQSALSLHADINRMTKDDPQLIKINQLASPSYRTLSKQIEVLAKEIGKQTKS
jgi:hypothetical protein